MKDTNPRFNQLLDWLQQPERRLAINTESLQTASSDASFRSYYRAMTQGNEAHSVIIMDAPPQRENNAAFIDNQQRLSKVGLKVPQILDADLEMGFLLLSDLGQQNLYHALMDGLDPVATQGMYRIVLDELVRMQQADTQGLPNYTAERMLEELQLFYTYFVDAHCKIKIGRASCRERVEKSECGGAGTG